MPDPNIKVVPYDPEWPLQFSKIKSTLEALLGDTPFLTIEHVGSTSIPGLWAKAVIDIDIVVTASADYEAAISPVVSCLVKHGFQSKGWQGVPGRWSLGSPDRIPQRNLYVCVDGCVGLRNHLGVRRILTANEALREEYSLVKQRLAKQNLAHMDHYTEGKSPVLQKILMECEDLTEDDRREIFKVNEANRRARPAISGL